MSAGLNATRQAACESTEDAKSAPRLRQNAWARGARLASIASGKLAIAWESVGYFDRKYLFNRAFQLHSAH
jgi:hypothetical protein